MSDTPDQSYPSPPAPERPAYPHDSEPQPDHWRIPPQTSAAPPPQGNHVQPGPAPAPGSPPAPAPARAPSPAAQQSSDRAREALLAVRREVGKAVVGQEAAVSGVIICLLVRGHVLLEGVPGVAKTLLVRALAKALAIDTKRVQFTPDLMPGDITGSLVYDDTTSEFVFREGPVFTNLLLADEINRTPPKTQASLLEAMEERQVSVDGVPRPLPEPFLVAATQNPVEYEGTYPLPEAQLDRFLLKLVLPLPPRDDELEVVRRHAERLRPARPRRRRHPRGGRPRGPRRRAWRRPGDHGRARGGRLHRRHRPRHPLSPRPCRSGVSPRGATALLATVAGLGLAERPRLRHARRRQGPGPRHAAHRLSLRPEAELEGVSVGSVLASVLGSVPVPR